jgi:hypothetical protein
MLVHKDVPIGFEVMPDRPCWSVEFSSHALPVGREMFDAWGERNHVDLVLDEAGDDCDCVDDGVVAVEELEEIVG